MKERMIIWGICCIILIEFLRRFKTQFCFAAQTQKQAKLFNSMHSRVMFYREKEPFLDERNAKELFAKFNRWRSENDFLVDANKQKMMRKFSASQSNGIRHKLKRIKQSLILLFNKLEMADYCVLILYLLLPVVLIGVSKIPAVSTLLTSVSAELLNIRADVYLSQLSLTFITISVMSIFSDGNEIVYWQDLVKKILIEPPARCFRAYFAYSFIYLLGSTISLVFVDVISLAICFAFNVLCLFDLSRIMIDCYYGRNSKKKKLVKEFVDKIELANIAYFEKKKSDKRDKYLELYNAYLTEVADTFDKLYYNTYEAYVEQRYITVKENIPVYGTLLARLNSAVAEEYKLSLLEWYDEHTHDAYRMLVQNYYEEYYKLTMGNEYSATSALNNGIEKDVIDKIMEKLSDDICNIRDRIHYESLVVYRFLVWTCYYARENDFDNLHEYVMGVHNSTDSLSLRENQERIGKNIKKLWRVARSSSDKKNTFEYYKLLQKLASFAAECILMDTDNLLSLPMEWIPWKELEGSYQLREIIAKDVESKMQRLSEERQKTCKKRLEEFLEYCEMAYGINNV